MNNNIKRGEMYYVVRSDYDSKIGSEQQPGRPAIIVSNNKCNMFSSVVEVVYLTTKPKTDLPTHVDIRTSSQPSIALCEQISSVSTDRIGDYIGTCSEQEMLMLDAAMAISIDINFNNVKTETDKEEKSVQKHDSNKELIKAETEKELYKNLYFELLERIVK